jgi:fibronectin type 3 domain-containing protein
MKIKDIKILFLPTILLLISVLGCSEIIVPEDIFPPATPRNFTLLGGGDGQVHFRWERNTEPDFKEYRLYRSVNNPNSFAPLVSLNQTEYVDRFLEYDSIYYYYLTAADFAGNESMPTNIIDVQPLNISAPQPPSRVIVSGLNNPSQGTLEIRISWTPPDIGDLRNYRVYRGTDSVFIPNASSFLDSSSVAVYTDRFVQLNQKYFYKIIAVDKGFKESFSSKSASDLVLSSPALISPANNTRFVSPKTFKWESVNNAVDYQVFVGNGPLSDIFWSSGKTKQTEFNYNGPTLQTSKVYYWWVVVYSKEKIKLDDGSELPAQINSYSLVNSFFGE